MDKESIDILRSIVGEDNLRTSTAELYAYSTDAGIHRSMPDVVVRPRTTEEVAAMVKLANQHGFPVVPRGAGTALCGHCVPVDGGVVLDLLSGRPQPFALRRNDASQNSHKDMDNG